MSVLNVGLHGFVKSMQKSKKMIKPIFTFAAVVKVVVHTNDLSGRRNSEVVSQLNEKLNTCTSRQLKERSKIEELLEKLNADDVELLNPCLEKRKVIAVHLWCKSQKALDKLREMHESSILIHTMEELFKVLPRPSDESTCPLKPIIVDIDSAHLRQEVGKLAYTRL